MSFDGSHTLTMRDIHPRDAAPADKVWWACSEPERPYDRYALFDWECDACTMSLITGVAHLGDTGEVGFTIGDDGERIIHPISEMLPPMLAWRSSVGLRTFGRSSVTPVEAGPHG